MTSGYLPAEYAGGNRVGVVLTQSCDVLNGDYEKERVVELWVGVRGTYDPQFARLKHPRILHLRVNGPADTALILKAHDRVPVPRWVLGLAAPLSADTLPRESLEIALEFVVNRYRRPAFPDAFNTRREPIAKRLRTILEANAELLDRVYLELFPPGEAATPKAVYYIKVFGIISGQVAGDPSLKTEAEKAVTEIAELFGKCPLIKVTEHHVRSAAEVTLAQVETWLPLDTAEYSVSATK